MIRIEIKPLQNDINIMSGINAAVLTPMFNDLSPDFKKMAYHSQKLLKNGCDGLSPLGTTGEALLFTIEERKRIVEELVFNDVPVKKIMPGTGMNAISDTVELTQHAVNLGVGGVLMLPPFYYKSICEKGIFAAYSEVIQLVGSSNLRVYLYNIPRMSGISITFKLIEMLLKAYPETIVGIKDSSGNTDNMLEMIKEFPQLAVFSGSESSFLSSLKAGGAGCITAGTNLLSPFAQRVYSSWITDRAIDKEANNLLQIVREIINEYPMPAALKAILAHYSGDKAWENIRSPLVQLREEDKTSLIIALSQLGFTLNHLQEKQNL